jgi:hypothetical protein
MGPGSAPDGTRMGRMGPAGLQQNNRVHGARRGTARKRQGTAWDPQISWGNGACIRLRVAGQPRERSRQFRTRLSPAWRVPCLVAGRDPDDKAPTIASPTLPGMADLCGCAPDTETGASPTVPCCTPRHCVDRLGSALTSLATFGPVSWTWRTACTRNAQRGTEQADSAAVPCRTLQPSPCLAVPLSRPNAPLASLPGHHGLPVTAWPLGHPRSLPGPTSLGVT